LGKSALFATDVFTAGDELFFQFRESLLLGSGYNGFNEVIKSDWKGSKIRQKLANF